MGLLEDSGYSYSGISNIVHDNPELIPNLLDDIESTYHNTVKKQEQLEVELEKVKTLRGYCVSSYMHMHKILGLGEKPLVFQTKEGNVVKVMMKPNNKIDHERFSLTDLPK